ncbi:MAG: hypothetical protein V7785_12285 [Bermanella sp.]
MLKKSLLSLAITASVAGLSGCNISSVEDNDSSNPVSQAAHETSNSSVVSPRFNGLAGDFPLGIDFLFAAQSSDDYTAAQKDGTMNTGAEGTSSANAVTNAMDDLDGGISTLAPIDINMSGTVLASSVAAGENVFLVKLPNAADAAGLTLPDGLSASDVDTLNLATIGYMFSTLKPDGTAPTAAGQTVAELNLGAIIVDQPAAGVDYEVRVISVEGTDNVIRVIPKTPLDAKTKYVVVVTNAVQGVIDGVSSAIQASAEYAHYTSTDELYNAAFAGIRASVDGWEGMAGAILSNSGADLTSGLAITAGFTTVDPQMVLKSMAYPGYWAAGAVVKNDSATGAAILAGAVAANTADATKGLNQATVNFLLGQATGAGLTADQANVAVATAVVSGSITAAYEHPRPRTFEIIQGVGLTVNPATPHQLPVSALTGGLIANNVMISQGAIELPQYNVSFATNPNDYWDGSTDVGLALDPTGATPPGDINGEKNATFRFPFAQEQRKIVAPVLMFEPTATSTATCVKPGTGWPVTILQHGFTTDRASHLINGTNIADNTCHAVIAMDLAHHGIPAESSTLVIGVDHVEGDGSTTPFAAAKAAAVATAQAAVDADAASTALDDTILDTLAERHENFYMTAAGAVAVMDFGDTKAGDSGSLFIRLDNFQRTRDNLRQSTMDLLNLNATLATIDIDGDGTVPDLDVNNVNYVGHSLGGIVGTSFIAVNNDATIQAGNTALPKVLRAVLATPGGSLSKLLENSVGFGPAILGGLSAAGITQGTESFESFMKIFQATVDSADPLNFIADLKDGGVSDTPTLITEMVGNIATGGSTPSDLGVPNNADGILIAAGTYALADYATIQPETARLPMVSTDAMLDLLGAENVLNAPTSDKLVARYTEGGHGTFTSAGTSTTAAPSYDSTAAYTEMLMQNIQFLTSTTDPLTITPVNTAVLSNAAVE